MHPGVEMTVLEAVEDGRLCGHCGCDLRINIPDSTAEMSNREMACGDSPTPGVRAVCDGCGTAGHSCDDYQET